MGWKVPTAGALSLMLLFAAADTTAADPLTTRYTIHIFERCEASGFAGLDCGGFSAAFPLILTFDSRITNEHGDEHDLTRFYGEPTFSDVPLPGKEFPRLDQSSRFAAERAHVLPGEAMFFREAAVVHRQGSSIGGNDYHRDISLTAEHRYASLPELGARSLAHFLGTASFRQFAFGDSIELASGGFEGVFYRGRVDLAATPEPATWLLFCAAAVTFVAPRIMRRGRLGTQNRRRCVITDSR
jgi:hypothetical protein